MENPLIAGIIQLERFIPVDIFHKKKGKDGKDGNSLYLLFD